MAVAKRQGKEKPTKVEQRKVGGPECRPQVEQAALLGGPDYRGQARGGEENVKRGAKGWGLSPVRVFGVSMPHSSRRYLLLSK